MNARRSMLCLVSVACIFFTMHTAHAGQWECLFTDSGTLTESYAGDNYTFDLTGPDRLVGVFNEDGYDDEDQDDSSSLSYSMTPKASWVLDGAADTSSPPSQAYFEVAASAVGESFQDGTRGSADDGLGDAASYDASYWPYGAMISQGNHIVQATSSSATATLQAISESASGAGTGDTQFNNHCHVLITPLYPKIAIPGLTTGGNGLEVLCGQQINASLSGLQIASSPTPVYQWSISGARNKLRTWDPSAPNAQNLTQAVPLRGYDLQNSNLSFYDTSTDGSVTISCTVTCTLQDGASGTFTVTSQPFAVVKPTSDWEQSFINANKPAPAGFFTGVPNGPFGATTLWGPITINQPSEFFGNGQGCIVQITSPMATFIRNAINGGSSTFNQIATETNVVQNGQVIPTAGSSSDPTGIDAGFPYPTGASQGGQQSGNSSFTVPSQTQGSLPPPEYSYDMPSQTYTLGVADNGGNAWYYSSATDSFGTWLMYQPPGQNSIWVPLKMLNWNWGGTASLYNGSWSVSARPAFSAGMPTDTEIYPNWTIRIPAYPSVGPAN